MLINNISTKLQEEECLPSGAIVYLTPDLVTFRFFVLSGRLYISVIYITWRLFCKCIADFCQLDFFVVKEQFSLFMSISTLCILLDKIAVHITWTRRNLKQEVIRKLVISNDLFKVSSNISIC